MNNISKSSHLDTHTLSLQSELRPTNHMTPRSLARHLESRRLHPGFSTWPESASSIQRR